MERFKLDKETLWNLVKYLVIGGTSFIIEITLFLVLRRYLYYIVANIIIYTLMFWLVFLANKFLNFKSQGNFKKQLGRYTILYFINLFITNAMLYALTEFMHIDPAIGKFFVTGAQACWNFFLYKFIIYKD